MSPERLDVEVASRYERRLESVEKCQAEKVNTDDSGKAVLAERPRRRPELGAQRIQLTHRAARLCQISEVSWCNPSKRIQSLKVLINTNDRVAAQLSLIHI